MRRHRYITIVVIGTILAVATGAVAAKPVSLHLGFDMGHRIARPIVPRVCVPPVARGLGIVRRPVRNVVITSPLRRKFIPIGHRHKTVVFRSPVVRSVVVELTPPRVVSRKTVAVEPVVVTVWIRNSNGSQSSVKLRCSGPGYIGPRGEYYPAMPDNEQLRVVYGF